MCLAIYHSEAADTGLCVEMTWGNRKLSQGFWMDGPAIRLVRELLFILEWPAMHVFSCA